MYLSRLSACRKSTSQHFDLGAVISSLLKTPPLPLLRQYNQRGLHYQGEGKGEGEGEGEFSGVMILLRRGRSAAKCSSAIHYSYHFLSA